MASFNGKISKLEALWAGNFMLWKEAEDLASKLLTAVARNCDLETTTKVSREFAEILACAKRGGNLNAHTTNI